MAAQLGIVLGGSSCLLTSGEKAFCDLSLEYEKSTKGRRGSQHQIAYKSHDLKIPAPLPEEEEDACGHLESTL